MCLGGGPPMPTRPKLPAPPATPIDPAVLTARDRERRRLALMRGRRGTVQTGPQGTTQPPMLSTPALLGAGGASGAY